MTGESKPFAVFDIDGTVIRWQLYHAVVDALAKANFVAQSDLDKLRAARMLWKRRVHEDSYKEYEHVIIETHDKAVRSLRRNEFTAAVTSAFDEYKEQTYTYTRDLIRSLKAEGYLVFAISASQIEVVTLLAEYYGFDDWAASEYEYKNDRFTGEKSVMFSHEKPKRLHALIEKHGASLDGSVGVGDSESDIPMLNMVAQPIAFNPNKKLFEHAKNQGWKVVVERKNMVYELKSDNGRYILA
jgi:HAD superfamily hydrolase (TIGR01490 family)